MVATAVAEGRGRRRSNGFGRDRVLSINAIEPEVIEQLRVWAVELAEEAD
jgi:hypothetical protein